MVFAPIWIKELMSVEKKGNWKSYLLNAEKRQHHNAQACAIGSMEQLYIPYATSLTAATEANIIMGVINAKQASDIITLDVPIVFAQILIPESMEKIIMKIYSNVVSGNFPWVYVDNVIHDRRSNQMIIYVQMIKALYGMLTASILYYKKV
jgi:hypothetical protein